MQKNLLSLKTGAVSRQKAVKWLKKLGIAGFLFFLVKGLLWLALGYWILK